MKLRYATLNDCADLAVLDRRVFGGLGYPAFVFIQMLEVDGESIEVALADGDVVGYCFSARSHASGVAWLLSLGVDKRFRKRGLGRGLTLRALQRLAIEGARIVRLTVDPSNDGAVKLYCSLGFEVRETSADYFGEGEDRLLMERALDAHALLSLAP